MSNSASDFSERSRPRPTQHVDSILASVLGKPFEWECSEITVKGILDHEEPLFQGPGTISGGIDGEFSFRLFDQLPMSTEQTRRVTESINSRQQLRLFALDPHLSEWTGGWFEPVVRISRNGRAVVSGQFISISTRTALLFRTERKNSTGLYYAEKLPLPMQASTESQVLRDGEIVSRSRRADHTRISDDQFSMEFREDLTSGFTEVIAQNCPKLMPPFAEIGLADALVYVLCRISHPRAVVRFFEDDALVFIRTCKLGARTGLPDPIRGCPQGPTFCWEIFKAFLRQYVGWEELSPVPTAQHLYEVISASNGTLHGFIVSLLLTIEKLFNGLVEPISSDAKKAFKSLRDHVGTWSGDQQVKDRALGLMTGLGHPPPVQKVGE